MRPEPRHPLRCTARFRAHVLACLLASVALCGGCNEAPQPEPPKPETKAVSATAGDNTPGTPAIHEFIAVGAVKASNLDEISGIQAGDGNDWLVHTDDGPPAIHVIDTSGGLKATIGLKDSQNQDWEDLTRIPGPDGPLLVIADSGDNHALRKHIRLFFYPLPVRNAAGEFPASLDLLHAIKLRYPDGTRDCESVALDPVSLRILFVTKRDVPPRIYGITVQKAVSEPEAELEFLGEMAHLRPPTPMDLVRDPSRGAWISQPTGMDISPDGQLAAIITYRSLYLFQRQPEETWPQALARKALEVEGPPGHYDEAVSFSRDQTRVIVTGENLPATIYQLDLTSGLPDQPGSMP